jgi:uncharacterized Rossmann fold enzyme
MAKKSRAGELENIADFFISSKDKEEAAEDSLNALAEDPNPGEAEFEVEETVSVRKRITYPDGANAQDNIKRCLLKHLEEKYKIHRVELKKTVDMEMPGNKKKTQEDVLILLKDSSAH